MMKIKKINRQFGKVRKKSTVVSPHAIAMGPCRFGIPRLASSGLRLHWTENDRINEFIFMKMTA